MTILQEMVGRRNAGKQVLEEQLEVLWQDILHVQQELLAEGTIKHALNRLELNWFWHGASDYPCVTKVIKAAQMKDLVQVVARICEQKCREGPRLEREGPYKNLPEERWYMMKNLARFYSICKEEGMFLSETAAEELQEVVYKCCVFYSKYTAAAQTLKLRQFSQVPKFHFLEHLASQGKFLNPKIFWTYMSEDFVGKVCRMGLSMLAGTAREKVALKIILNYRMAWFFWLKHTTASFD